MKKVEKKENDSTKGNFIFNIAYQVINTVSPLVVTPKLSRVFGVEYLGIKSYTFSIVYYFAILGLLGLDMYGQRKIAIERDNSYDRSKTFWTIFFSKIGLCGSSLVLYLIVIQIIAVNDFEKTVFYCWTIYLVREMINPAWFLQGMGEYKTLSVLGAVSQIIYVACSFVFISSKELLPLYVIFFTAIPLAISITYFPTVSKYVHTTKIAGIDLIKSVRYSAVYFIPTITTAVYSMVDKTMLGGFDVSRSSTGLYESSEKMVKVALAFSTASFTIMRTRMSYLYANADRNAYDQTAKNFISFSMMLCWPIMFGVIGISKDFVPIFFGGGFEDVILLSYVFSLVIPCLTISGLLQAIYIFPFGLQKMMNRYYGIIVIINIVMNLILISLFDTVGAVIASVFAEMLLALILYFKAKQKIDTSYIIKCSINYVMAAIGMLIAITMASHLISASMIIKVMIEFILGIIMYFSLCIFFKDKFFISQVKAVFLK